MGARADIDALLDEIARGRTESFGRIVRDYALPLRSYLASHVHHTDDEYARTTPFGHRVAHGLLVLSMGAGCIPLEPGRVVALLGMDSVRFLKPTFIGDTIHPEMEVVAKRDSGPGGVVDIEETIVNQHGDALCSTRISVLVARRPKADSAEETT